MVSCLITYIDETVSSSFFFIENLRWNTIERHEISDFLGLAILNNISIDHIFSWDKDVSHILLLVFRGNCKLPEIFF